jgi:hypothetical protein
VAVLVFKDGFISLGGTEYSDHAKTITLTYSAEALDKTAMTNETRTRTGGLKDWTLDVEWYQDYADNHLDETLFNAIGTGVALVVRPTTAAAAATNPQYSGTGLLESYNPVAGEVGTMAMTPTRFSAASDLARAVA